jgi:hypothetical protein
VEALPLGQREQLVLVVHPQVFAEQTADLCLSAQVVIADDDSLVVFAALVFRGGGELLALLHFLVGKSIINQKLQH